MADTSEPPFSMNEFWATRSFKSSARLHLQHYLFQNTIGYLIHPRITQSLRTLSTDQSHIRIADLGCGNGRWLIDVAESELPGTSLELHGFDIKPENFPATIYRPNNVKLDTWDIFASELPHGLEGSFDVVHIRAITSCIHNNDPSILVRNATKLLKPGGWLQWEESTADQLTAISPAPDVPKSTCDMMIHIINQGAKSQNLIYDWCHTLDAFLQQGHLGNTQIDHIEQRSTDLKAWTENYLLVWEDIGPMLPSKETNPTAPLTREMWTGLFLKAVEETNKGVAISQKEIVVAVGRKQT